MPRSNVALDASIFVPEIIKFDTLTKPLTAAVASNSLPALAGGGAGDVMGGTGGVTITRRAVAVFATVDERRVGLDFAVGGGVDCGVRVVIRLRHLQRSIAALGERGLTKRRAL